MPETSRVVGLVYPRAETALVIVADAKRADRLPRLLEMREFYRCGSRRSPEADD